MDKKYIRRIMKCSKLLDYNLVDVEGLVLLNERFNIVQDQFEQAELVVAPPDDGIFASKLHDHDMIKDYRKELVFDTKYQEWSRPPIRGKKQIGEKFTLTLKDLEDQAKRKGRVVSYKSLWDISKVGAYVAPAILKGKYVWVCLIDFHKEYPNAIISSNAGIRTTIRIKKEYWFCILDQKGKIWDRKDIIETPIGYFRKDIESINNKKFRKWIVYGKIAAKKAENYLEKVKDQNDPYYKILDAKEFRIKIFRNGGFGIMGYKKDRNYSRFIFNNAILMSRDLTLKMIEIVESLGYKILMSDTDSCAPILKSDNIYDAYLESIWLSNVINIEVDKYLDKVYNIQEHTMSVGVETISDKFIVKGAKNYVKRNIYKDGTFLEKPQLEVKGIEMKKRNTSEFVADMQETLINILLDSDNVEDEFKLLVKVLNKHFSNLPWEYIAPRGAINKNLDEYEGENHNARGARNARKYFNKYFDVGSNPRIMPFKIFPKKLNGYFVSAFKGNFVLSFDEEDIPKLQNDFVPDYDDLKRSQIRLKTIPFLDLVDLNYDEILAEGKVSDDMML